MNISEKRDPLPPLLSVEQVCALLGLPRKSLYALVERRAIPFVRVGRLLRFDRADLIEWISQRRVPASRR